MNFFFKEFNNREIAIFIWIALFIIAILFVRDIRRSIAEIAKLFLSVKLQMIFIPVVIYSFLIIYMLRFFKYWELSLLKDTIFWFFGVAFSQLFRITNGVTISFFKKIIIDSIKLTVLLEFILNIYSFSLPVELVLVFVVIVLSALKPMAEKKEEYKSANSCITKVLSIGGALIIAYALYQTISHFREFFSIATLKELLLSPILTILYLPFLYTLAVLMTYEILFIRLKFQVGGNKVLLRSLKWQIFSIAKLNVTKLNNVSSNISKWEIQTVSNTREYLRKISKTK